MALSTTYFDPLSLLSPKSPNFALQIVVFPRNTLFHHHRCTLGTGRSLPKTTFRAKINGAWARGALKNLDPLFISATVEASNFKFGIQLGLGAELAKKQLLRPKLAGVRARGASKKCGTPYTFLQPLKLATSNLVYKLWLGSSLPRNNF